MAGFTAWAIGRTVPSKKLHRMALGCGLCASPWMQNGWLFAPVPFQIGCTWNIACTPGPVHTSVPLVPCQLAATLVDHWTPLCIHHWTRLPPWLPGVGPGLAWLVGLA